MHTKYFFPILLTLAAGTASTIVACGSGGDALTDSTATAAESGERLTVDLRAVEYLDSSAINALYHVADRIHLIVNSVLMRSLTISGLAELVAIEVPHPKTAALDEH